MMTLNPRTKASETKPVAGIITKTSNTETMSIVTNGVTTKSNTSGTFLRTHFSTLAKTHTAKITPMIPPLPVVNTERNGVSSLNNPKIFEISTMFAPIEIPPIIPPNPSVAPNCLAALIPV